MAAEKHKNEILVPAQKVKRFVRMVLKTAGVRDDVADHVTEGLLQASLRGVDSHGVRLLPHYLSAIKGGRINPCPDYEFRKTTASTGLLDADHTFGHAACMEAAKKAVELASEAGTGHVAVYNSTHFGAAAYYALEIAKHDMIGLAFTNTDALVKTYGGKRPFLGNNPIAFAAPCKGEEPFCLDMATSIVTFNKIRQLKAGGLTAPAGIGADSEGIETTDPGRIKMLLPIGGYKGYGLSMMIEILCGPLTGMPYGPHIPKMFEAPMNEKRYLGHFVMAIRIDCFQDKDKFKERLSMMMGELRNEAPQRKNIPVQVAGDPEKKAYYKRMKAGVSLSESEYGALKEIGEEYGIRFE